MKHGKPATILESRSSKQTANNDVEKPARENGTGVPIQIVRSNKEMETADDAVASKEEVKEQAEESRIDKVAFEDGISTASAEEYIRRGPTHD
jgi:hypothetical protein